MGKSKNFIQDRGKRKGNKQYPVIMRRQTRHNVFKVGIFLKRKKEKRVRRGKNLQEYVPEAEEQARSGSKRRKGHDVVLGLEKEQNRT